MRGHRRRGDRLGVAPGGQRRAVHAGARDGGKGDVAAVLGRPVDEHRDHVEQQPHVVDVFKDAEDAERGLHVLVVTAGRVQLEVLVLVVTVPTGGDAGGRTTRTATGTAAAIDAVFPTAAAITTGDTGGRTSRTATGTAALVDAVLPSAAAAIPIRVVVAVGALPVGVVVSTGWSSARRGDNDAANASAVVTAASRVAARNIVVADFKAAVRSVLAASTFAAAAARTALMVTAVAGRVVCTTATTTTITTITTTTAVAVTVPTTTTVDNIRVSRADDCGVGIGDGVSVSGGSGDSNRRGP